MVASYAAPIKLGANVIAEQATPAAEVTPAALAAYLRPAEAAERVAAARAVHRALKTLTRVSEALASKDPVRRTLSVTAMPA